MKKYFFLIIFTVLFFLLFSNSYAAFYTPSETVIVDVGIPTIGDKNLVGASSSLADSIKANCGGAISSSNYSCISNHIPASFAYPENVYNEIRRSAGSYRVLQCVGFVQAAVSGVDGKRLDRGGDAKDFVWNVPTGYNFIRKGSTIVPGDIPVWGHGAWGHIAVAIEITERTFRVAEANVPCCGKTNNLRYVTKDDPGLAGWLRKK